MKLCLIHFIGNFLDKILNVIAQRNLMKSTMTQKHRKKGGTLGNVGVFSTEFFTKINKTVPKFPLHRGRQELKPQQQHHLRVLTCRLPCKVQKKLRVFGQSTNWGDELEVLWKQAIRFSNQDAIRLLDSTIGYS